MDSTAKKMSGWREVNIFSMEAFLPVTPSQFATIIVTSSRFAGPRLLERLERSSTDEADVSVLVGSGLATGVDVAFGRVTVGELLFCVMLWFGLTRVKDG